MKRLRIVFTIFLAALIVFGEIAANAQQANRPGSIRIQSNEARFADMAKISISINIPVSQNPVIYGDRAALLELFVNIVDNATKYNILGEQIDISIKKEKSFILTEIRDTGAGIAEKDLDQVFDRFYRVNKSRSREIGGVGLGLSICDEIVKLHGGRIEIRSQVNIGATVCFSLKEDGMLSKETVRA